jgi:fatty-acyl-CoA synthase
MAAIVADDGFDLQALHNYLRDRLPSYAVPLFVRILPSLSLTETFKQKKQDLVREGFDPSQVANRLFFRDASAGTYVPLDAGLHTKIVNGNVRI